MVNVDEAKNLFKKRRISENLLSQIKKQTSFLPSRSPLKQRLWHILNQINSIPKCLHCKINDVKWDVRLKRYREFCCSKCSNQSKIKQERIKATNNEKYGADWSCQNNEIREKQNKTKIERYGVDNLFKLKEVQDKICKNKTPEQIKLSKEKRKKSLLERYGVNHNSYIHLSKFCLEKINDIRWLTEQHHTLERPINDIAQELKIDCSSLANQYRKHNIKLKKFPTSVAEKQIITFIKSLGVSVDINSRSIIPPKEIDIFVPENNLAIEYCGLFWHNDNHSRIDRNYHLEKLKLCNNKKIRLITIFEDEWLDKEEIVKSKLKTILNKSNSLHVFARKCNIVNVSSNSKKEFFDQYHIQGTGPGSISVGLAYENRLVACSAFIKQQNNIFVLNRYASSCQVVGGFSRILKYFVREYSPSKIISFADLRWSEGQLYETTGWKLAKILPPDYYDIVNNRRIHKFNFRHKNLPNLLKHYNPSLSEVQNTQLNNIPRIWNCGLKRYSYNRR